MADRRQREHREIEKTNQAAIVVDAGWADFKHLQLTGLTPAQYAKIWRMTRSM
jgi:hypothetical protein